MQLEHEASQRRPATVQAEPEQPISSDIRRPHNTDYNETIWGQYLLSLHELLPLHEDKAGVPACRCFQLPDAKQSYELRHVLCLSKQEYSSSLWQSPFRKPWRPRRPGNWQPGSPAPHVCPGSLCVEQVELSVPDLVVPSLNFIAFCIEQLSHESPLLVKSLDKRLASPSNNGITIELFIFLWFKVSTDKKNKTYP